MGNKISSCFGKCCCGCCQSEEEIHPRKGITLKQAKEAYNRCKGHCFYCGKSLGECEHRKGRYEIDHQKSVNSNGKSEVSNYVAACFECNRHKSDKPVDEWLTSMNYPRRCIHLVEEEGVYCAKECFSTGMKYCVEHQLLSHNHVFAFI
jgi:hypothetical protein